MQKLPKNLWLCCAAAALTLGFSTAVQAGASSADTGNGDPAGYPGLYGTSASPAAFPDSPGAGPYSGPTNNRVDPMTGAYAAQDDEAFNPNIVASRYGYNGERPNGYYRNSSYNEGSTVHWKHHHHKGNASYSKGNTTKDGSTNGGTSNKNSGSY